MRALIVLAVLGLLWLLVRQFTEIDLPLDEINPVLLGYGALFASGIVVAELMRPLLSLMSASSRFVVIALLAGLVWAGFEQARQAGRVPEALLAPPGSEANPIRLSTRLPKAWDGVYRTVAQVNNMSIGALIDTATPYVLLQFEEAERLGLDPGALTFSERLPVSDRKVTAARLMLVSVRIDDVELFGVEGAVAEQGALEANLIGLSFLSRLETFGLSGDRLLLVK